MGYISYCRAIFQAIVIFELFSSAFNLVLALCYLFLGTFFPGSAANFPGSAVRLSWLGGNLAPTLHGSARGDCSLLGGVFFGLVRAEKSFNLF